MIKINLAFALFILICFTSHAQIPAFLKDKVPVETTTFQDLSYANDTIKKHQLDIYVPSLATKPFPVIIWIHGGAWMLNDKYADMGYMTNTIAEMLKQGYAIASIDYRYSTTAIFPAQLQDCRQALDFLAAHAKQYNLDKSKFILCGFSAGGHLASLTALSLNQTVPYFNLTDQKPSYSIKAVLDFYGPSNFLLFYGNADPKNAHSDDSPIAKLLGISPLLRPDLAALASPATYVDKNDPPFFIAHGEKDNEVPVVQSFLLKSYLDVNHVTNEITIVPNAPHYGVMFDTEEIKSKMFSFLKKVLE
jgi:acetyl esterase/lipase